MTQINKTTCGPPNRPCCQDVAELIEPKFFRALCDPNRVAILARLAQCGRSCTVGEIACCCPVDVSVVSRHLAILRDAGILEATRRGKEVYYCVRFDTFVSTLRVIADAIESCCPPPQKKVPLKKEKRK
ncbi:MAG: winged helix-turn-helix transcriptional regulator [Planctomycetia bacterium]|nr:winged helix-turn-helix transcriptional regulator [Planctomycetia bacterium]MCC7316418.1 winged helix-turn-helix transcriptional regulator [Planctomycetota bacterium]